jgi:hypothetical protein
MNKITNIISIVGISFVGSLMLDSTLVGISSRYDGLWHPRYYFTKTDKCTAIENCSREDINRTKMIVMQLQLQAMLWLIHMICHEKHTNQNQESLLYVIIKEVVLYHWSLIAEQREMHLQNRVKPHKQSFKRWNAAIMLHWFYSMSNIKGKVTFYVACWSIPCHLGNYSTIITHTSNFAIKDAMIGRQC